MNWYGRLIVLLLGVLAAGPIAQGGDKSAAQKTIRVGIAVPANRSGRQANPIWGRDQLVRELQRVRTNRKSSVVIEAVSLDASTREDAAEESARKDCQYFVLTTLVDARQGPGLSGGPNGTTPAPVMIGNARPSQTLAINFTLLDVSDSHSVAEGTGTGPVEERNETRAMDEAMGTVAHQVANSLRQNNPPKIN